VAGKTVAGFAAFKAHLSYLAFSGSFLGQLADELHGYTMTKSVLHFPVDRPVVDEGQIVLAAEITNSTVDWSQLDPMVTAALAELEKAGVIAWPEVALADSQYWNEEHMDEVIANKHRPGADPARLRAAREAKTRWDRRPLHGDA
jgi:hypothetical protein